MGPNAGKYMGTDSMEDITEDSEDERRESATTPTDTPNTEPLASNSHTGKKEEVVN